MNVPAEGLLITHPPRGGAMFPIPSRLVALALIAAGLASAAALDAAPRRPVLAYWAFNCFTTCGDANLQPESISQATASMTSSFEPDNGVNESGTPLNAVSPYEARSAMTLRTGSGGINNGRDLTWRVNASTAAGIVVSFATRRSIGGFSRNQLQYSLDGSTWTDFGAAFDPPADWTVLSYDLRHVRGLIGDPNAAFRIVFQGGSTTSSAEYCLIDNLQVGGK
jgi:hypothetical protein